MPLISATKEDSRRYSWILLTIVPERMTDRVTAACDLQTRCIVLSAAFAPARAREA